jgi:hypothetical protein
MDGQVRSCEDKNCRSLDRRADPNCCSDGFYRCNECRRKRLEALMIGQGNIPHDRGDDYPIYGNEQ